jgi:hypothetical protein
MQQLAARMFSSELSDARLDNAAFARPFDGIRRANDAVVSRMNEISC